MKFIKNQLKIPIYDMFKTNFKFNAKIGVATVIFLFILLSVYLNYKNKNRSATNSIAQVANLPLGKFYQCNLNGPSLTPIFSVTPVPTGINPPTPTTTIVMSSCLSQAGPVITLSGSQSSYSNSSLADLSKIDSTQLTIVNNADIPVKIGGGNDICWHSGKILGGFPLDASWDTTHPTAGLQIYDGTIRPKVEGVYIERIGDGIKVRLGESSGQAGISQPFTVKDVWMKDIRDDCIESDWQAGAIIDDNLFDGCYTLFATEKRSGDTIDGSNNFWEIKNTLAYMHDQIGVYKGVSPGHSMFFKWDQTSPKLKIYDTILRVDSNVSETSNQFNFRLEKLADCANNTLVWLGPGDFPANLPSCFTLSKEKSVWDNAVANWKIRHGLSP